MVPSPKLLLEEEAKRFDLDPSDPKSVLRKKNEIFKDCILEDREFFHPDRRATSVVLKTNEIERDGLFLLKVGVEKKANLPNKLLVNEEHSYYPYVFACFDNRPQVQMLAVQNNPSVFSSPKVVAKTFQENANVKLLHFNLECVILPQFDENDFWKFVKAHQKTIVRLQFLIMAPNLPRISESISAEFNLIQSTVCSQSAKLDLQSTKHGHLVIEPNNAPITGLAKAAADGGGEIKVQIRGFKRLRTMAKTTKEVTIAEFNAEGKPREVLDAIIGIMGDSDD